MANKKTVRVHRATMHFAGIILSSKLENPLQAPRTERRVGDARGKSRSQIQPQW